MAQTQNARAAKKRDMQRQFYCTTVLLGATQSVCDNPPTCFVVYNPEPYSAFSSILSEREALHEPILVHEPILRRHCCERGSCAMHQHCSLLRPPLHHQRPWPWTCRTWSKRRRACQQRPHELLFSERSPSSKNERKSAPAEHAPFHIRIVYLVNLWDGPRFQNPPNLSKIEKVAENRDFDGKETLIVKRAIAISNRVLG